jgi:hypothetical protein
MNHEMFYAVLSEKRANDGCTPLMRQRFDNETDAIEIARQWAAKSDHGGKYTVYQCVAVGTAQRSAPPVQYTNFNTGEVS